MKRWKTRYLVWVLVPFVVVWLGKGCMNRVNEQVKNSTTIYNIEPSIYIKSMDLDGRVVPKTTKREFYRGYLESAYVKVGEHVKKGDKLVKSTYQGKTYVCKASVDGDVIDIQDEYLLLSTQGYELEFDVSLEQKEFLYEGQELKLQDEQHTPLTITYVSSVVTQINGANRYTIRADLYKELDYGMHVCEQVICQEIDDAIYVPIESVVMVNGEAYVVFDGWLDHVGTIESTDFEAVEVLDANHSFVQLKHEPMHSQVLVFTDEGYLLVQAMIKDKKHD